MADLVTVNNLIDQNEAAAQGLSTQVDHVLEAVSRIEQLLTTISGSIAPTSQKIQTNFAALKDSLEAIANEFKNEIQQAKETLNKAHQKVEELEGQVDEMANEMTSQPDELRNHTEETLAEIESETEGRQSPRK